MEPEIGRDAIHIKQELIATGIKEEKFESSCSDNEENTIKSEKDPSFLSDVMKYELIETAIKKEKSESSCSDNEEDTIKSEKDPLCLSDVMKYEQSSATPLKNEYCYQHQIDDDIIKFEEGPVDILRTIKVEEPHTGVKIEQLVSELKHEDCFVEEVATASEGAHEQSSTTSNNGFHNTEDTGDLMLKFEEEPVDITFQTAKRNIVTVVGTCRVPSSSDDTAFAIPNLQNQTNEQEQRNNRSKEIHHRRTCSICHKSFKKCRQLKIHMRIHTGDRPFSCKICNKSYVHRKQLNAHVKTHTGELSCEICNKSFSRQGSLNTHMRTHTGERPFSCEICNESFICRAHLNNHMHTHTGERPFSCEICNKSFTRQHSRNIHMRTHTGERPFSCEICNKSFICRGYLNTHVKSHTGEFSCKFCNKSFIHREQLDTHVKTHTLIRPFSCEICNKSFTKRGNFERHMRTLHK